MSMIVELTKKRENLLIEIASVTMDLREYISYPVETVDIEQIKYQYGFILREIKEIDSKIKFIFLSQSETLKTDLLIIDNKLKEIIVEKKFTVGDLPKLHHSMFNEPFI